MAAVEKTNNPKDQAKTPWWLWPNLLSLDAPLVAVSWLFILALGWRNVYIEWASYIALGCIVWVIYVLDRIIDARALASYSDKVHWDKRHEFHYKHRGWFLLAVVPVMGVAFYHLLYGVPQMVFRAGIVPFCLCILYALIARARATNPPSQERVPFLKNFVAGYAFALGTAVSAAAWQDWKVVVFDLFLSPEVHCFALLCILNITAVDLWADSEQSGDEDMGDLNDVSLMLPLLLLSLYTLYMAVTTYENEQKLFSALFVSSACFYLLNRFRKRFGVDARRVLTDVALLVPVPIFYW